MGILSHYLFLSVCGYLTGVLCLVLAFLVFQANPRSRSCQITFLFNLSVATWAVFYATMYHTNNDAFGMLASQILTFGTILLSVFFTHLVLVVVKKEKNQKKLLFINYLLGGILILIIFATRLIVESTPPKFGFKSYTEGGPLYILVPIYLFTNVLYSLFHLAKGIRKSKGYRKNQLSLFFIAALIGYAAGTPAFLLVLNIPIKPLTTPLVSLYPIILTYAIVKHRFLDIEKLVKNTLIFSLLFIMLLLCVSVMLFILKEFISRWIGIPEAVSQGIAIALAIGLYGPLKEGLSRLTNRTLFQHLENPEIIFRKLSHDILQYLDMAPLAQEVTKRVAEILALDRIYFYTKTKRSPGFYELQAHVGKFRKTQIHQSKQLIQYLERSHEFIINPLTEINQRLLSKQKAPFALINMKEIKKQAARELAALGGVAAFPVFVKDSLRAVLIIGRKKSDAPWRDEEFRILNSFSRHLSLAVGNAEYAEAILRSRQDLARSERDASAGALIAGVDHEVNNPLHSMTLSLTGLRAELSKPHVRTGPREHIERLVVRTMQNVLKDAGQVNAIIQHLSDLANRQPLKIQDGVRPARIATKVIRDIIHCNKGKKVRIESKIPEHLSFACDPDALYEILSNLIRNGLQAITEEGLVLVDGEIKDGETVIKVKDTGTGIPRDYFQKIFEPFFSTKLKEQNGGAGGSGMGLFIIKEYIQGMGGRIEVESKLGEGSVFRLHFPSLEMALREAA